MRPSALNWRNLSRVMRSAWKLAFAAETSCTVYSTLRALCGAARHVPFGLRDQQVEPGLLLNPRGLAGEFCRVQIRRRRKSSGSFDDIPQFFARHYAVNARRSELAFQAGSVWSVVLRAL